MTPFKYLDQSIPEADANYCRQYFFIPHSPYFLVCMFSFFFFLIFKICLDLFRLSLLEDGFFIWT